MTVVFTSVILSFTATAPDKETAMAMAFTVVILAGLFQILFGVFRLGRYVTQMPYTVISGFMSGIGAILVILQLPAFLGQKAVGGVMGTLSNLPGLIMGVQPMELALAVITVALLVVYPCQRQTLLSASASRPSPRHPAVDDAFSKRRLKNNSAV
jgi:SulP family sulfate permease